MKKLLLSNFILFMLIAVFTGSNLSAAESSPEEKEQAIPNKGLQPPRSTIKKK
jgi:hypothetical protein